MFSNVNHMFAIISLLQGNNSIKLLNDSTVISVFRNHIKQAIFLALQTGGLAIAA